MKIQKTAKDCDKSLQAWAFKMPVTAGSETAGSPAYPEAIHSDHNVACGSALLRENYWKVIFGTGQEKSPEGLSIKHIREIFGSLDPIGANPLVRKSALAP